MKKGSKNTSLIDEVNAWQVERQAMFEEVPEEGQKIEYLGKEFIVYKGVFWPFDDSKPLVENMEIYPGESVLDVCTGCGVIAVFSAYNGAGRVVALDIMPNAVRAAKENAKSHGFGDTIDVRLSDMFDALDDGEQFDIITGNLPFRNLDARDAVEATMWDKRLRAHMKFFAGADKHLKSGGRVYLSQANFGTVKEMKTLADYAGFNVQLAAAMSQPDPGQAVFYAFQLERKE